MCPIFKKTIDDALCYDIHMVTEGLAPDWTVPERVLSIPEYKEICMRCKIIKNSTTYQKRIGGIFIPERRLHGSI